jgi:hypothetical protein
MEYTTLTVLKENIRVIKSPMSIGRLTSGSDTCLNVSKESAPSTLAASYRSLGIACKPASVRTVRKGMRLQASAMITPPKAKLGLAKMLRGSFITPNFISTSLITPNDGLNIHAHMKPERTIGTAQGIIINDLKKAEPLTILFRQRARVKPTNNVKAVEPKL